MKKIVVLGSPWSGKSTFSKKLQEATGLPLFHLDKLFWKPWWEMTPREEQEKIQKELVQEDKWIIDGNYTSTVHLRVPHADTIIFFDLPRSTCMVRVLKRVFKTSWGIEKRTDMGEWCNERISMKFLGFVWNFRKHTQPKVIKVIQQSKLSQDDYHIFTKDSHAKEFIERLKN